MPPSNLVLDVGCGTGNHDELDLRFRIVGIDISQGALQQAKRDFPEHFFVCATGEKLPFAEQTFSLITSRVALPYMNIPVTLREMYRVLTPRGELRLKLYPPRYTWSELMGELKSGPVSKRLKNLVYRLYVTANGLALLLFGLNFRFPLAR